MRRTARTTASLAALVIAAFASQAAGATTYTVDVAHTSVGFSVKHMVISKVKGHFSEFEGSITYDENDPTKTSASGTIKVASIDTDNEKRDSHLRSKDFFDAENYPEITFESKRVEKRKEGYVMIADITIRGVTKEIEIPFEVTGKVTDPMGNERIGFEARTKINRKDFGVAWNRALEGGGLIVANEVEIELNVEAMKAPEK